MLKKIKKIFFVFAILSISILGISEISKTSQKEENLNYEARKGYAELLTNLHKYDEALVQYQKLLKEKPHSSEILERIAEILYYQGYLYASQNILETLPQDKIDSKEHFLMGDIDISLHEFQKAEEIYKEEAQKDPTNLFAKFKLAELLSWEKRYPESIAYYEELLEMIPNDIQVRRKYALTLLWMGNETKAATELKKTLRP